MNKIIIIGMGPGDVKHLTLESHEKLMAASDIYFRTIKHPVAEYLIDAGINYQSYDEYYESYENFDDVYEAIAKNLIEEASQKTVYYAVPGNPTLFDDSIRFLHTLVPDNIEVEKIHGTSVHEMALSALNIGITDELSIVSALSLDNYGIRFDQGLLITEVINPYVASDLKLKLMKYYQEGHRVYYVHHGKMSDEVIKSIDIEEIDRMESYDHLTCIFLPKAEVKKTFANLASLMAFLRSDDGCSWDRKQTNRSLMPYTLEEVYELIETIEQGDVEALEEELGDFLLQVIFYAQINAEEGYFDIYDVITKIYQKLIRRHPHLFNDESGLSDQDKQWEQIKKQEYAESYVYESMERIPKDLPSLMAAYKIQDKASKVGFDWPDINGAFDKIHEEIDEVKKAMEHRDLKAIEMELGDLIFSVVNVARFLKVRPEFALRITNQKFIKRFRYIEEEIAKRNEKIEDLSLDILDGLWEASKK